jgi:hypothetical protein
MNVEEFEKNEDFERKIKKMDFDEFWMKLIETGWINELPQNEIEDRKLKMGGIFYHEPNMALIDLATWFFDCEIIDDSGDYSPIIMNLAEISQGKFCPTNVYDECDFDKGIAIIEFEHKGKKYRKEIPYKSTIFENSALEIINSALADAQEEYRFYALPILEMAVYIAFIPEQVYQKAKSYGLVPPDDYPDYLMDKMAGTHPIK